MKLVYRGHGQNPFTLFTTVQKFKVQQLIFLFFLTCPKIVLMFVLWFAKQNDGGQVHDQVHFHQEFSVLKAQIVVVIVQSQLCSGAASDCTMANSFEKHPIISKLQRLGPCLPLFLNLGKSYITEIMLSIWITRIPSLTLYCFETLCW